MHNVLEPFVGVLSRGACCLLVSTCFHIVFKCFLTYNIYIGAKFVQPSGRTGTKEVIYGVPQRRWCKTCRTRQHDAVRHKKLRRAARLACPRCWQVTPGSVLWKVISSCSTKKTVPHDANWPASCDLLQKRTFFIWSSQKAQLPMAQAGLLQWIHFQWHKLVCFI